jgi:XTP/dITP diphosphohydrolase
MVLVMIQFLFLKIKEKTFGEMSSLQKYKIDHRFVAFKKIRKFL